MPIKSSMIEEVVPNVDAWEYFMESPRNYPDDQTLYLDGETGRSYTFAQTKSLAADFGKGLKHKLKWQKGDVMGLYTPNHIDVPPVTFGILWAGGIMSPANPTYTPGELANQLRDSGARALVTQKPFLPAALEAAAQVGMPAESVFLLGDGRDESGKHAHWSDINARDAWLQPGRTKVDVKKDLAYLVYSSGTTGLPKGVMLSHENIVANSVQSSRLDIKSMNWDIDTQLGVLPFFHIYGLAIVLGNTIKSGVRCVIMAKFDLEKACKLIQDYRITFMYVPPPIVLALGKHPIVDKYDLSSLRWINSAAAPLSRELVVSVWERLKVGVKQGYGLSETSPVATMQFVDEWWKNQGSVGRLVPNMEAMIVGEDGKEAPTGESGELYLKGPNIFKGYWKKPDLDKENFTEDGWYKTGDVFYVTKDGQFYITDRIKELIKYKGFQVPPAELEAKIIGRKDVADVCVIGVWDKEQHTEVPRAYIVLTAGEEPSEAKAKEITAWLDERVAPPKKLRGGVRFIKEVPKSQAGKILRRVLRDQAKKEDAGPQAKL
ncbi:hypothetical protein K4F52_001855 [Lecanicillium sp. MT-2017a]|nr:hypothetical protein K4F52_001855 [Lecanicillium sp. MT-2017a]